jgi:hypothetical protein
MEPGCPRCESYLADFNGGDDTPDLDAWNAGYEAGKAWQKGEDEDHEDMLQARVHELEAAMRDAWRAFQVGDNENVGYFIFKVLREA